MACRVRCLFACVTLRRFSQLSACLHVQVTIACAVAQGAKASSHSNQARYLNQGCLLLHLSSVRITHQVLTNGLYFCQ